MLVCMGAWAYSTTTFTNAQDSKGNSLVSGGFYRILLPSRGASVALKQNGDYVQAYNGLGILGYIWKMEADANGYAIVSNPAGGYWKLVDHNEGNSKLKTDGTSSSDCTAFQMAWASSYNKTLNLFDPTEGTYTYDGVKCGTVLSNHGGVGKNMGIYNNILDGGSIFKFERFYQTLFVCTEDINGVAVEGTWPVTINGNISATTEYYTNSDNQITSFSTSYAAKYYIGGVEKTAEEVKTAINANTGTLTVTVKPEPFVASTILSPVYYAIMISGNANSWWQNTNGTVVNCAAGNSIPDDETGRSAWIWQVIQNGTDGYQIYSVDAEKYLGGRTATGGAFTLGAVGSANSFIAVYNDATTFKFKDKTNTLWIDRASVNSVSQPYAHTSGQQITMLPMYKVTFSEGVAVNGGSDVTTIYVKGDGSDSFTLPDDKLYSINGGDALGNAAAVTAIAACSSNITVTVSENTQKDVTYTLKWSDGSTISSIGDVATYKNTLSSDYLPSSMASDFVTLAYDPEEIGDDTDEVTVTATWNGPFQISSSFASAQWYTVASHKTYESNNYIWKYDGSSKVTTKTVATDDFASVTGNNLFAFVGNPYDGFTIYNYAAGNSLKLTRADDESTEATMGATATLFVPKASNAGTIANGYFCLQPKSGTNYINMHPVDTDAGTAKLEGWDVNDEGSTCWVIAPGQYYLDFIDALNLSAPVGAVGTNSYFTTLANPASAISRVTGLRSAIASSYMYSNELSSINSELTPIKECPTITLGEGYWRIVSAYSGYVENQSKMPAIYYNSSENQLRWSIDALTSADYLVNSIIKLDAGSTDGKYTIYSPNAQKYLYTTATGQSENLGTLGDTGNDITFTSLGSCQYQIFASGNNYGFHTNSHSNGSGTGGTIVAWNGTANTASSWYIVKASELPVGLHTIDEVAYATLYLPFDVTISGADAYTMVQSGDWMVPTQLEDNEVPAGTAVLLKGSGTSATATINTGSAFSTSNDNDLLGVYVPTDFALDETANDENDVEVSCTSEYFLGVYNSTVGFYRSGVVSKTDYYTLGANKAYLGNANASRGFAIKWNDDEVTGIRTIDNGKQSVKNGAFYDLSGRRVENPQHGMYIVNGRVVVIK